MRITKDQQIGGVPARDVRDILRKLHRRDASWHEELRFEQRWFERWFHAELYWLRVKDKGWYKDRHDFHWWFDMRDADRRKYHKLDPGLAQPVWDATQSASAAVIEALIAEGCIEPDADSYRLTRSGKELCRATLTKPVNRRQNLSRHSL